MDTDKSIVEEIRERLGSVALLPIVKGQKGPFFARWQDVRAEWLEEPERTLEYLRTRPAAEGCEAVKEVYRTTGYMEEVAACAAAGGNLGVVLRGNLCALDIDSDEEVEPFLEANPLLRQSMITRGARGVQIWVRILTDPRAAALGFPSFPPMSFLKKRPANWRELTTEQCRKLEKPWGEWRTAQAAGAQSIVWGEHPSGKRYEWLTEHPAREVYFSEIVWPDAIEQPWRGTRWLEAAETFGAPWTMKEGEISTVTEWFWAALYALEYNVLYEEDEGQFYVYEPENGGWHARSRERIKVEIGRALMRWRHCPHLAALVNNAATAAVPSWRRLNVGALCAMEENLFRSSGRLASIASLVEGMEAVKKKFRPGAGVVHVKNGMIDLRAKPVRLERFSPWWYSRNQIPIEYKKGARALKFLEELAIALPQEDIDLLQRWGGQLLLGRNHTQKFMILAGTAGGGKSTVLKVLQCAVGLENCVQMRHEQLGERFELFNYVGKTFLAGVDVPGHFLSTRGAYVIKGLTGGDLLTAEAKGLRGGFQLEGCFNLGITCNGRLKVRLDADSDAWRRRLMIVRYERPKPETPIDDFAEWLVEKEGGGILIWLIKGALKVLAGDRLKLSEGQKKRVNDLLDESDSVRVFLRESVVIERGSAITSDDLTEKYFEFCEAAGWDAESKRNVERALPDLMLELYRARKSKSIKGADGASAAGFRGVTWLAAGDQTTINTSEEEAAF